MKDLSELISNAERENRHQRAIELALEHGWPAVALCLAEMHEKHLDKQARREVANAFFDQGLEETAETLAHRWLLNWFRERDREARLRHRRIA